MNYTYQIFDGKTGVGIGRDAVTTGGLLDSHEIIIQGFAEAHIITENAEVSEDGLLWMGRVTTDFLDEENNFKTIFIRPIDPDKSVTIRVEPA